MRIDGVSEETDADGTVTSHFEYFRQREEMSERAFGMPITTAEDIEAEDRQLETETARLSRPPPLFIATPPATDVVYASCGRWTL